MTSFPRLAVVGRVHACFDDLLDCSNPSEINGRSANIDNLESDRSIHSISTTVVVRIASTVVGVVGVVVHFVSLG